MMFSDNVYGGLCEDGECELRCGVNLQLIILYQMFERLLKKAPPPPIQKPFLRIRVKELND